MRHPGSLAPHDADASRRLAGALGVCLIALVGLVSFSRNVAWYFRVAEMPYPHVAAADAADAGAVVPLFIIQPQVELAREALRVSGPNFVEVNARSGRAFTPEQVRTDPARYFDSPGIWSLMLKAEQSALGWTERPIDFRSYFGWVEQATRDDKRVVVIAPKCFEHLRGPFDAFVREMSRGASTRVLRETACYRTTLISRS